ncbi:MAG: transporter [Betaproteobacteria bacterium]|nr:transporter [Betaproteobacteria bacterium]
MLAIINVTAPFFALVLCGFLAARFRMLPENAVPALNTFVLYFALPCMLFRFSSGTPFAQIFNLPVFAAYMVTGLSMLAIFVVSIRFAAGEGLREAAFAALAVSWSNWGYMGFALLPSMLGQASLAPLIAAGMADLLVLVSTALALASLEDSGGQGVRAALRGAALRVSKNPLIWSVVAGALFSAFERQLPMAADTFARLLGNSAGPVALFTIGVSLYRPGTHPWRGDVLMMTGAKLLLHPYLAALVAMYLFGLDKLQVGTLVLMAAMPVAGTVFLFAERQGANSERVAAAILVTTALAFFSFSALCWAFGIQVG